jgi:GntR family transcriptional regulator/MocR family aminotransferase
VRRTEATPDRIVICNGFAQALHLALCVLRELGAKRVAVEDPGQDDTPAVARHQGLDVETVPVDDDGIDVDALARVDADAVVVTSAHQFPMGGVLPPSRRDALVRWAVERRAFIIEDDYDAEYRYDREPIGAIQGLAPERVIYAGTASKVLAPGLRLGWIVAPLDLVDRLADAKVMFDRGSPAIEQLAFADFVARGGFDHHLRRMRPLYRRRRDRLLDALARLAPDLRPVGASAGAHLVAILPEDVDEAALVDRAAALGVQVYGLQRYRLSSQGEPGGLVFGYGGITEADIAEGMALVAQALAASKKP